MRPILTQYKYLRLVKSHETTIYYPSALSPGLHVFSDAGSLESHSQLSYSAKLLKGPFTEGSRFHSPMNNPQVKRYQSNKSELLNYSRHVSQLMETNALNLQFLNYLESNCVYS